MVFQKKYTDEIVMDAMSKYNNIISLGQLSNELGCTTATANNIMNRMIIAKSIQKVNVGVYGKKNSWVFKKVE